MSENCWNTSLYESQHAFVWQYGENLLELLSPQPGERILDLGCGTGQLTEKIALTGAEVMGIDSSSTMITKATANYPHLQFAVADARNFQVEQPFDAVFSNAVLHWVTEPDAAIRCIRESLKPGGRLVAEFGGKGNIKAIATALYSALESHGWADPRKTSPWYFPSIGEYTGRLEQQGFDVIYAVLWDRPTPLESGEAGLGNWIRMFASSLLSNFSLDQQASLITSIEHELKPTRYHDGTWIADYRRLRIVAIKE